MTDLQAAEIIETVIKSHWPNWTFTVIETREWVRTLAKFDFQKAKSAISEFYMAQTRQGKPAPGALIMALRAKAIVRGDQQQQERTGLLFGICRADGRLRWSKFSGSLDMAPQEVEAMALKYTRYANQLEAGHYYELYPQDNETEGYSGDPGGTITQRRQQARDKAFVDILNGDDTKTRRWLENYITKKHEAEDSKDPVLAGDAIEI